MGKEEVVMVCPMCEAGELEHKEVSRKDKETLHAYVCNECPAVLIENLGGSYLENL